jgi:AcrR family transcriptional regulator
LSTTRRYDSTARQVEARSRRASIVAAAADLFLERGYGDTTIAQVAAAAGVSPQLVYAAFGGKAGLLAGVLDLLGAGDEEEVLLRDRPDNVALMDIPDPSERLRAAAALIAELNGRTAPLLVLVDQVSGSDPAVHELRTRILENMRTDHRVQVDRLAKDMRPDLGPDRLADVTRVLTGHQVWHGLVVDSGWSQQEYADWLGDALIRLLITEPTAS